MDVSYICFAGLSVPEPMTSLMFQQISINIDQTRCWLTSPRHKSEISVPIMKPQSLAISALHSLQHKSALGLSFHREQADSSLYYEHGLIFFLHSFATLRLNFPPIFNWLTTSLLWSDSYFQLQPNSLFLFIDITFHPNPQTSNSYMY